MIPDQSECTVLLMQYYNSLVICVSSFSVKSQIILQFDFSYVSLFRFRFFKDWYDLFHVKPDGSLPHTSLFQKLNCIYHLKVLSLYIKIRLNLLILLFLIYNGKYMC